MTLTLVAPATEEVLPISIHREGTFRMQTPATDTKCGPAEVTEFRYEACIHADEGQLDSNGWIVDGTDIYRYFTETLARSEFESCERLTLRAVRDLRRLAPGCRAVEVRLWNGTNAIQFASRWSSDR